MREQIFFSFMHLQLAQFSHKSNICYYSSVGKMTIMQESNQCYSYVKNFFDLRKISKHSQGTEPN